jgi:hypothetical protein
MARGRDAADVAIVTSFGLCTLASFKVITDEVTFRRFRISMMIDIISPPDPFRLSIALWARAASC